MAEASTGEAAFAPSVAGPFFAGLAHYLERGIGSVEGWLWPTAASMLAELLVQQGTTGLHGDVCEIGVHHGRLFLILANATLPGERAVAVDVFGEQEKNLDRSGAGERAIFERHIADYAPAAACEIIQGSSLDLQQGGFEQRRFRFFSIDGGHTAPIVVNDLRIAEATLLPGGFAALDDVLNHVWPGVITGLTAYLAAGGRLLPFALIPNKLLLAPDAASAAAGRALLRRHFPRALSKPDQEFPGGLVDCYVDHPYYNREGQAGLLRELEELRASHAAMERAMQAEAGEVQRQAASLVCQNEALAAQLVRVQAENAGLRASTSWRATAPLRGAVELARRRMRKG